MYKGICSRSSLNDNLASILLFACALALVLAILFFAYHSYDHHVDVQRVELCYVPADSVLSSKALGAGDTVFISKASIDSIVSRIEAHEAKLSQKYQYILEKREEEENYRTVFMLVFSIAAATVGFFGYKSFSDIEKKAKKTARIKASEVAKTNSKSVAKDTANATAQKYCEDNVDNLVQGYLNNNLQNELSEKVKEFYNGPMKQALLEGLTRNLDIRITNILKSDEGNDLINGQINDVLNNDQILEKLVLRLKDLKKEEDGKITNPKEEENKLSSPSLQENKPLDVNEDDVIDF